MSDTHVRLRVGGENYALPVENVIEVSELEEVASVPGSGAALLGVLNLRGQVLPAFDLARVFGIPPREGEPSRLVVAESNGRLAGLAIDEVTDVASLAGPFDDAETEYLAGSALRDGELVGVMDVEAVFAALEREATA